MAASAKPRARPRRSRTTRRPSMRSSSAARVTNNALAERLGVTPASASSMVKKLDELGLVEHVPYKGVKLTDERSPGGARGAPPPPAARAVPGRVAGRAVGPRARRGRGARARAVGRAGGADRGEAGQPHSRPARRPDPDRGPRDRGAAHPGARVARDRVDAVCSCEFPTRTPACSATSRSWASRRGIASRSWTASPSGDRCSRASEAECTRSAASWRQRCGSSRTRRPHTLRVSPPSTSRLTPVT